MLSEDFYDDDDESLSNVETVHVCRWVFNPVVMQAG